MAHDRFDMFPRTAKTRAVAERLVQEAFGRIREKRSSAYQQGTTAILFQRMGIEPLKCPYLPGQAEFDAYWAGAEEGKEIHRRHIEGKKDEEKCFLARKTPISRYSPGGDRATFGLSGGRLRCGYHEKY